MALGLCFYKTCRSYICYMFTCLDIWWPNIQPNIWYSITYSHSTFWWWILYICSFCSSTQHMTVAYLVCNSQCVCINCHCIIHCTPFCYGDELDSRGVVVIPFNVVVSVETYSYCKTLVSFVGTTLYFAIKTPTWKHRIQFLMESEEENMGIACCKMHINWLSNS